MHWLPDCKTFLASSSVLCQKLLPEGFHDVEKTPMSASWRHISGNSCIHAFEKGCTGSRTARCCLDICTVAWRELMPQSVDAVARTNGSHQTENFGKIFFLKPGASPMKKCFKQV